MAVAWPIGQAMLRMLEQPVGGHRFEMALLALVIVAAPASVVPILAGLIRRFSPGK